MKFNIPFFYIPLSPPSPFYRRRNLNWVRVGWPPPLLNAFNTLYIHTSNAYQGKKLRDRRWWFIKQGRGFLFSQTLLPSSWAQNSKQERFVVILLPYVSWKRFLPRVFTKGTVFMKPVIKYSHYHNKISDLVDLPLQKRRDRTADSGTKMIYIPPPAPPPPIRTIKIC